MTTKDKVIQLTKDNLQRVFGETSAPKRLEMIRELWVPSSEALFVDPLGVFKSHEAISDMVVKIQAINPGQGFTEIGDVDVLKEDAETDTWFTRLKWGVGPKGGEFVVTGEDIVTIEKGKIKSLYTFLDEKK